MKKDFFVRILNIFLVFLMLISNVSFTVYGEDTEETEIVTEKEQITVTINLTDGFSAEGGANSTVNEDGYINPININLDEDMSESFSDDLLNSLNDYDIFKNNNLSATYDRGNHILTISGAPKENVEIDLNGILSNIVEDSNEYNKEIEPTEETSIEVASEETSANTIYVSNSGNNDNDGSSSENAVKDLASAYSKVTSGGKIILLNDVEQISTLNLNSNKTVTITSYDNNTYSISRGSSFNDTLLNITSGSITLSNITVDGSNKGSDFLVKVGANSGNPSLTLDSGATISNNAKGGILLGVSDSNSGKTSSGTLNIKSGSKITNMTGCGTANGYSVGTSTYYSTASAVLVLGNNTIFNMEGGEITNNNGGTDSYGTIVFFCNRGTSNSSIISGGTISNNTNGKGAGAIFLDAGGRVTLSGGTIQNNKSGSTVAGAVSAWNSSTDETTKQDLYIGGGTNPLIITDNKDTNDNVCNLRIISGKIIQRADTSSLAVGSKIGVSISDWPTSGGQKQIVSSVTETEKEYFESDYKTKAGILRDSDGKLYLSADREAQNLYVKTDYTGGSSDGTRDKPYTSIANAYSNAVNGDTIVLLNSFNQNSVTNFDKSINITLTSDGTNTYTITRNNDCNLFDITNGTLTLKNIKLTDTQGKSTKSRKKALILIGKNNGNERVAELVLDNGAIITDIGMTNDTSGNDLDWGIIVVGGTGTLTMNAGATISNCTADSGPIRLGKLSAAGLFNMNGGTIENCDSNYQEGTAVYIASNSVMNMSGGIIKNCGQNNTIKGTIYLHNGNDISNQFVMTGGEITGNKATLGGGVYSNNSGTTNNKNVIKISGTAKIYGNKGTDTTLGGESNIYLLSGQTITIGDGGMQEGANVGVYTAATISDSTDVKFATNANANDIYYFHSDKQSTAGVLYCDGTSDTVTSHHTSHASNTLWLSTATKSIYTVNIANITGITADANNLKQSGINNNTTKFNDIVLSTGDGYQDFTDAQLNALNIALGKTTATTSTSGLYAELSNRKITIKALDSGMKKDVSINLADIFTGDNALQKCEAQIGNNNYPTLEAALDAAKDNSAADTIVIKSSTVTAVNGKVLNANDTLQDFNGNTYKASTDSTINVDASGNVTLTNGKLEVNKKTDSSDNVSVNLTNDSNTYIVSGDSFIVDTNNTQTSGIGLSIGSEHSASINNVSFKDGEFSISKDSNNTVIKGTSSNKGTVTGANSSDVINIVDSNTTITADSNGNIKLTGGSGKSSGNMTATINSEDKTFTKSSDTESYTVNATDKTLTVPANTVVSDEKGIKYIGEGTYTFNNDTNKTITISNGATIQSKETEGNGVSIAGVNNTTNPTKVKADNGNVTLIGGSGSSSGKIIATIGNTDRTFSSENNAKYTIDVLEKKVTLNSGTDNSNTSVKMGDNITFSGKENDSFTLDLSGTNTSVSVSNGAKISGNGNQNITDVDTSTKVEVDANGNLTLVEGKGKVTGETTVSVKIKDSNNQDKTVSVTVPSGKTYTIDTSDKGKVTTSSIGDTVTVDGITYTSGTTNSTFILDNESARLTNNDDKISIPSSKTASVTLGNGDTPVVVVPSNGTASNTGETTITKTSTGGTVTISKKDDTFKLGDNIYAAESDNTTFNVDNDGNVKITSGSVKLDFNSSITGNSGKTIKNTSSTSDKVTVTIGDSKDTVTLPNNGDKVTIVEKEYEAASDNTTIEVTSSSNKLTSGSVKLDKEETINVDDFTITNNVDGANAAITVNAGTGSENKGTITIPSSGKTAIKRNNNETTIESTSTDSTVTITSSDTLKVKLPAKISGVEYTNTDSTAEVTIDLSSGNPIVTVPNGTTVKDNNNTITTSDNDVKVSKVNDSLTLVSGKGQVTGNVAAKISEDKTVNVTVPSDKAVTLDTSDKTVSGLEKDATVTVDGITYTSGSDNGSFSLENAKLTNDGDKASIAGSVTSDKTIAVGDSLSITVPGSDSGKVSITKTTIGATVSLEKSGDTFKVGNNTYTSDHDNTTYTVSNNGDVQVSEVYKILKDGESYTGSSGKTITNPSGSNNDEIKVTINSPSANTDTLTIPGNGKVKIGDTEYENASSSNDLIIEVTSSDNKITSGSVKLDKNEDIKVTVTDGSNDKSLTIKNTDTSSSNNEVVAEAIKGSGDDSSKSTAKITVSGSGSIAIGDKAKITNPNNTNASEISVGDDGKLSVNTPINVNGTSYTSDNDSNASLTIDPDTGKVVVTIPTSDKKVKIGEVEYTTTEANTQIEKGESTNKLIYGAVKLDKDETIGVGNSNTVVKNLEDGGVTVTSKTDGAGEVTITQGKKISIGNAIIKATDSSSGTTATINTNGQVEVSVPVVINDIEYTGDSNTKITVNPTDGKIISINGNVAIDEKVLEDSNFSYDLKPNNTVTIGKYTYSNESASNSVTINSRGKDTSEKTLNPSITLKDTDDKVKVTLKEDSSNNTTYTAVSNAKFAMSESDSDTKNIDLLDNNNQTNNSSVKNIKDATVNGGGNSIKALADNAQIELKDSKATLVSGKGSSNSNMTAVVNNENKTFSKTSGSDSYTVDLTNKTLTVPSGTAIKDEDGVRYSAGTYTFNNDADKTISLNTNATISSKDNGDGSIVTGVNDTKVKVTNGNVTLVSGGGKSSGIMTAVINNNGKTFSKSSGTDSYTVDTANKTLEVPENTSVKSDGITYEKGKYTFNDDGTISITDNGKITVNNNNVVAIDDDAKVKLNNDVIELVEGKATVNGKTKSNLGSADYTFNSDASYTIDKSNNKLIVPTNTTVIDADGVRYIGEGEYIFNTDKTISLNANAVISSKDNGDGSTIIGLTDTKVKVTEGNVSLVSGNAKSNGKMTASINGNTKAFELISSGGNYEVDTLANTLKVDSNSSVKSGDITYEKGKYTFNNDGSIGIADAGKIAVGNNTLAAESDAKVKVSNDVFELTEGKATVTGKVITALANTTYTFTSDSNASYTVNKGDCTLNVPSGVTVTDNNETVYVGPGEFKFNDDKTINLNSNATIGTNESTVASDDNNTKVKVTKIDDNKNILELVDGKVTVKGEVKTNLNGDYTFESVDGKEYTIDKSSNKLTITDSATVKDNQGVIYKGNGSFTFETNKTITVEDGTTITSKEGGNGSSITGTSDASNPTTIKVEDGNITLIDGKGTTIGKMLVEFKNTNLGNQSFNSNGASYTVDTSETDSSVTLNNGTDESSVSIDLGNKIKLIGKKDDKFTLGSNDSKTTISIPNKARITGKANSTIEGDTNTNVEVDSEGNLTLVGGKANVIGLSSIDVEIDASKTVKVTASIGSTVTVDKTNRVVTGLSKDETVRVGDVVYTAIDGSSFSLDDNKLTKDGEKATVLGGASEDMTISLDTILITVPSSNSGDVAITKNSPSSIVNISKKGDKFTIGDTTYTSKCDNALYSIDKDGNVKLIDASTSLEKNESITGGSGKKITNNSDSTLEVTTDGSKDTIIVPTQGGKVEIDDTEYETNSDNTQITIDKDGNTKLTEGSISLDKNESIIGVNSNKLIKNPSSSKLIISIDDSKDIVTIIDKANKVKIGDNEYESVSDNTKIEATTDINKLISGSIKLDKAESIVGGNSNKEITNSSNSALTITTDETKDTVLIPAKGGSVKIGDTQYTTGSDNTTTTVEKDENVKLTSGSIKLDKDQSIISSSGKEITNTGNVAVTVSSDGVNDKVTVSKNGKVKIDNNTYEANSEGLELLIKESGTSVIKNSSETSSKVITCEEEMKSNSWTWSESKKACVYKVPNTKTK